jgi:hypothetical protein
LFLLLLTSLEQPKIQSLRYTVHHTCSQENGLEHVEKEVPFLSEFDPSKGKQPYLGEGFYFWEYNQDYSKTWGELHYKDGYYVCEAEIDVPVEDDAIYLDLVGNRKQMIDFFDLLKVFEQVDAEGAINENLSEIISLLSSYGEEIFPWKIIRAVQSDNNEQKGGYVRFNDKTKSYTFLKPRILFCFKNKDDIVYSKKANVIFASQI